MFRVSRNVPSKPFLDSQEWYLSVMLPTFSDVQGPRGLSEVDFLWSCCLWKGQVRVLGSTGVLGEDPCGVTTTMVWSGDKRPFEKFSLLLDAESIESNESESWL